MNMADNWKQVRLGDVCRVIPGYAFKSKDWRDGGIPVIKIKNIQSDRTVNVSETDFVPESIYSDKLQKFVLSDGDIVLAMTGATAGKVGKLKANVRMLLNQRVAKIQPVQADSQFIWALVSSDEYQARFFHLADGAAQPNMSGGQIEGIKLTIPDLPVQRKIASVLSAYGDLMENNRRRIAILEEMAQRLYREWFVEFRFPGHENVKLVDSPLGQIPEGWEILPFTDIADFVNGFAFKPKHQEPTGKAIIKIAELKNGITAKTPFNSGELIPEKYHITNGDVLFSWSANLDVYIWMLGDGLLNQHLFTVLPKENSSKLFLYFSLKDRMGEFRQRMNGTTMKHIKRSALSEVKCCTPDDATRLAFETVVSPLIDLKQALITKQINLRTTRDLLLPKLISGEVDVSELDIQLDDAA